MTIPPISGEIQYVTPDGKLTFLGIALLQDIAKGIETGGSVATWGAILGSILDQIDLVAALAGKASVTHNHSYPTLNDLPTLGTAAAANVGDFAAALHGHTQDEVLNLEADLAGKQPAGSYATGAQGALADTASQPGHTHTLAAGATDVTITAANLNTLDDGADTALHFHTADRARATHTGTQLAATVSDFSTAADARVVAGITGKQDTLVSGTNIKTINGGSILGAGDLVVSGGGGAHPLISWMI